MEHRFTLRPTPFHQRTSALMQGAAWRRWAGYTVASSYELSHEREYYAIRNSAALFDVSPLYKYHVTGRDAARLLDRVVTRDVGKAKVGQVLYTTWCDGDGKVIDDGTVSRLGDQRFRLTAADPNYRWLGDNARQLDVAVEDVSEKLAALALRDRMRASSSSRPRRAAFRRSSSSGSYTRRSAASPSRSRARATLATWVTRSGWMRATPSPSGTR